MGGVNHHYLVAHCLTGRDAVEMTLEIILNYEIEEDLVVHIGRG